MATGDEQLEIPDTGAVFTLGKSKFNENEPGRFWIRDDMVVAACCGDEHTALVTESGRLFTFGANDWGQLGLGHNKSATKPTRVKVLKSEKVVLLACGRLHTIVSTESGKLYAFGANGECQLGLGEGSGQSLAVPTLINSLPPLKYKQLAAGNDHSVALTDDGTVYLWGSGSEGQLGQGSEKEAAVPRKLEFNERISYVACGYYHTAIVTDNGRLYTFGEAEDGKLGLGNEESSCDTPQEVSGIDGRVKAVSCGSQHTMVLTDLGTVYTFGDGTYGQLGHGNMVLNASSPREIQGIRRIKAVNCGENHSALVAAKGQLMTFGCGRHGKLGLGEENFANNFIPTTVEALLPFSVYMASGGGCHMVVLAKASTQLTNGDWSSDDEVDSSDVRRSLQVSGSLDFSGSISARNRRRERFPDPGGTLNRTLPPLNTSVHGLPPLRTQPEPIYSSVAKPRKGKALKKAEESESEGEENDPLPKQPKPLPRTHKQEENSEVEEEEETKESEAFGNEEAADEEATESEEDASEENKKELEEVTKAQPVPAARTRKHVSTPAQDSEEDEEEDDAESDEVPVMRETTTETQSASKSKKHSERESDEEKDEESEEEEKTQKKPQKKKKRKKAAIFGKKKVELEDEDEDEDDEEEASEQERKTSKKKKRGILKRRQAKKVEEESDEEEEDDDEEEQDQEDEELTAADKKQAEKLRKQQEKAAKEQQKKEKKEEEKRRKEEEKKRKEEEKKKKKAKKQKVQLEDGEAQEEQTEKAQESDENVSNEAEKQKEEEKKPEEKKKSRTCIIL